MSNSRAKGSKNERELSKWWQKWSGLEFSRVPASGGLRWQKKDDITGDLICTDPRRSRRFPFSIETKFYKDINFEHLILGNKKQKIIEFWEQAKEDGARANRIPILFMRYNMMPKATWFVAMETRVFKELYKQRGGTDKFEYAFFVVRTPEQEFTIINSNDLLSTDYKKFSITLKKRKRTWV